MIKQASGAHHTALIIEDDEILTKVVQKKLSKNGYEVTTLNNGAHLPYLLERHLPLVDIVVLDIMLPGKDGIYWLKWLKQYHPHIPIIIASAKNNEDDRLLGLQAGADDYIVKPFNTEELLIRINRLLSPKATPVTREKLHIKAYEFDIDNRCLKKQGHNINLTEMETKILQLLHINLGKTVSREDMVQQIWGTTYFSLTNRTVDAHIAKLRKKLEEHPKDQKYIRTVRGKGYNLSL